MGKLSDITEDARHYYAGGKRITIDGIPCRVASHFRIAPGKAFIKAAVVGQVPIDGTNGPLFEMGLHRFRFTPAGGAREEFCKPSGRGSYSYPDTRKLKTWKPAGISLAPMYSTPMAGDGWRQNDRRKAWANGDPQPLRDWLAETADERRAYWAAYDAMNAPAPLRLAA
jgi:hypothetical protein